MSRIARVVLPDVPMHVVHRGNRRAPVFLDDVDRASYLEDLAVACGRNELELWAYCLMTNHVHLLVVPRRRPGLARVIRTVHQRHAVRLNARAAEAGHLWHNRYFSTVLDEQHLWAAVRYIELNPVRAGMVPRAELYPWSSARAHCRAEANPLLTPGRPFPGQIEDWSAWLEQDHADTLPIAALRRNSRTGAPTGSPDFVERLTKGQVGDRQGTGEGQVRDR